MRALIVVMLFAVACAPPPYEMDAPYEMNEPKPCGCDAVAEAEGRLCHRLTQAELIAVRGEVGPGWENCPPLPVGPAD